VNKLQPAGMLAQLASLVFSKQMTAELRTETLDNGQVQVTPLFTIDGQEVPPELIGTNATQSILGYSVRVDGLAATVIRETQRRPTRLSKKKAAEFLRSLKLSGVPVRTKAGGEEPRIQEVRPEVSLVLNPDDSLVVDSSLVTADGVVVEKPEDLAVLKEDDGWFLVNHDFVKVMTTGTPLDEILIPKEGNGVLAGEQIPRFLKELQNQGTKLGAVEKNDLLKDLSVFPAKPEHVAKVDGDKDAIKIDTSLVFKGPKGAIYEQSPQEITELESSRGGFKRAREGWIDVPPDAADKFRTACKDIADRLGDLSDVRGSEIPQILSKLLTIGSEKLAKNPWAVYFSRAVQDAHRLVESPADVEFRLNIVESDGRSLLELDPIYNHQRFSFTHRDVESVIAGGDGWVRRRDAWVKVDVDKFRKIKANVERLHMQPGPNGFTFPASERERVIDVFSLLGTIRHSDAYAEFLAKLADFEKIEEMPLPSSLRSNIRLRPYQQHGYNWLAFLHRFGLNGILADDMGLGKTLQTLAVTQRAKEMSGSKFPVLIICPTSVVNNWKAEIGKFFHDAPVVVYTGGRRESKLERVQSLLGFASHGLTSPYVITSYDIARRDHDKLNELPWLYVVVDEGHNIKNPDAERTKAIKTINGQHKLALTGTPIQNNLAELWSLFDFAMPGYLGTRSQFQEKFGRNGTVNWEAVRSGRLNLKDRIHPFVLRRLKEHVAKDLPPKMVVDQKVELTPLQVRLYKQVTQSAEYQKMVAQIDAKGLDNSRLEIFAALSKLRGICNHPCLVDEQTKAGIVKYDDSGKLEALKELIEEVVDGEHRALLFSQSTQMLDIIEDFFRKWEVNTLRLDGNTAPNKRQLLVDQFNGDKSLHCFLISTKAGGTGLNLTGADTVIFYDHDWNPANDMQAQDRAYRIGQTKPVTVYRLISQGTIEEKILERQSLKRTLADEIIGADGAGFKDITRDELFALFKLDESDD